MKSILAAAAVFVVMTGLMSVSVAEEGERQKAVLVTGASSGIGLKITEVLAANGFYVYAGARKADDLKRLDGMENVSSVRLDVTKQDEIDAAVKFVEDANRGLWGVVNNAGVALVSSLASGAEDEIQFTFDVNVFGPFRINRAFLPMLEASSGRTTTISSISGYIASDSSSYSMSKFAVEAYTDSLAGEIAETGVHVSAVQPGAYKSKIRDAVLARAIESSEAGRLEMDDETRKGLEEFAASNEGMKEPDEVAEAVLDLLTSETPKRRYMVTPNEEQAAATIKAAMKRTLELNEGQIYSYDRDELVAILDELLGAEE